MPGAGLYFTDTIPTEMLTAVRTVTVETSQFDAENVLEKCM